MRQITSTLVAKMRSGSKRLSRLQLASLLLLSASTAPALRAQDSTLATGPAAEIHRSTPDSAAPRFAKYRQYPWNGFSIWAGGAYETRTASHNEHFAGSMRIVGVQVSRDVWRGARLKIAYLGEVLPVMHVHTGPPVNRIPDTLAYLGYDQRELNRFKFRDGYGFGLAPFGAEATLRTSARTSALFNITAGGLIFTQVIPTAPQQKRTSPFRLALRFNGNHKIVLALQLATRFTTCRMQASGA